MPIIRTAQDMACALDQPLDTTLKDCLRRHWDALKLYGDIPLEELALFVIVQAGDRLEHIEENCGYRLVADGSFVFPVESITDLGRRAARTEYQNFAPIRVFSMMLGSGRFSLFFRYMQR